MAAVALLWLCWLLLSPALMSAGIGPFLTGGATNRRPTTTGTPLRCTSARRATRCPPPTPTDSTAVKADGSEPGPSALLITQVCYVWCDLFSLSLSLSFFPILFFSLFPLLSLRSPYMFLNPFSLTILDLSWNIFSINFSLFEHVLYCFDFTRLLSLCFSLRLTHVSIQISFVPPLTLKNLFHELTKSSKCFPFFVAIMKITNFTPVICCYW